MTFSIESLNRSTVKKQRHWIHTCSGREIDLEYPSPDDVDPLDIAHSLSLLPRFTGHTEDPYTVAQHSVVGSILAELIYPEVKWLPHEFVMHDSPEAYVGDMSSPLKALIPEYKVIESRHRAAIEQKMYVSLDNVWIKVVDLRMLATERIMFMPEGGTPWNNNQPPFDYLSFKKALLSYTPKADARAASDMWEWMWTPWSHKVAETNFLNRMWKLGL